jgi:hypothetical protein
VIFLHLSDIITLCMSKASEPASKLLAAIRRDLHRAHKTLGIFYLDVKFRAARQECSNAREMHLTRALEGFPFLRKVLRIYASIQYISPLTHLEYFDVFAKTFLDHTKADFIT